MNHARLDSWSAWSESTVAENDYQMEGQWARGEWMSSGSPYWTTVAVLGVVTPDELACPPLRRGGIVDVGGEGRRIVATRVSKGRIAARRDALAHQGRNSDKGNQ